jgi:branched-chain amino acid transport system substrate-binding protein
MARSRIVAASKAALGTLLLAAAGWVAAQPIKIGGIFTQEGPAAAYGIDALNGARLAIDELNAKGGVKGRPLALDLHDDKGDAATAAALMRKIAADQDIPAVLFAPRSPVLIALSKMAPQVGISLIGIGSSSPWPGEFNDWTFRFSQVDSVVAQAMWPQIKPRLGVQTAATIYALDDEWAKSMADLTDKLAPENGVKVIAKESFKTKDTDFRASLTKIAANPPDLLVVIGLENEASLIMKQARQLGIKSRFLGYSSFSSPKLIELAGGAAQDAVTGVAFLQEIDRPQTRAFVQAYKARYGKDAPANAAHAYDAVLALAKALENAPKLDRVTVRQSLGSLSEVDGATGRLGMAGKGDAKREVFIVRIDKGTYAPL